MMDVLVKIRIYISCKAKQKTLHETSMAAANDVKFKQKYYITNHVGWLMIYATKNKD